MFRPDRGADVGVSAEVDLVPVTKLRRLIEDGHHFRSAAEGRQRLLVADSATYRPRESDVLSVEATAVNFHGFLVLERKRVLK